MKSEATKHVSKTSVTATESERNSKIGVTSRTMDRVSPWVTDDLLVFIYEQTSVFLLASC